MKATLRRNGKRMITTRTTHHLDAETLAMMVALERWPEASDYGDREDVPDLSRQAVEDAVRDHLYGFGLARTEYFSDYLLAEAGDSDRALEWGHRQVERCWPDMIA